MEKIVTSIADLFVPLEDFPEYRPEFHESDPEGYWVDHPKLWQEELERIVEERLELCFQDREEFKQYTMLYAELTGRKPFGILEAHGFTNGQWTYNDGIEDRPVQEWINEQDGKYGTLNLITCNPGVHTPHSRNSLLWAPNYNVPTVGHRGELEVDPLGGFGFDLIVPGKGMIDSYVIGTELNELRTRVRAQRK